MAAAAAAIGTAVSFPSSKSSASLPTKTSFVSPQRIFLNEKVSFLCFLITACHRMTKRVFTFCYWYIYKVHKRRVVMGEEWRLRWQQRCQWKKSKESKKEEEVIVVNKFKPKDPYTGRCLLNSRIIGDDAPSETWHVVFTTEGTLLPNHKFNNSQSLECFWFLTRVVFDFYYFLQTF